MTLALVQAFHSSLLPHSKFVLCSTVTTPLLTAQQYIHLSGKKRGERREKGEGGKEGVLVHAVQQRKDLH